MRTNSTNPAIFQGGKNVYGAAVGILMLETSFPRVLGDIGNAATWRFPVMYRVVPDASPDHVVRRRGEGLLEAFISAGRDMVRHGADGITTNCGFLALFQDELATALGVPVATSSLMQVPFVERMLPAGKRVGVLTISAASLTADHLKGTGVAPNTPIVGTDSGRHFSRAILEDEAELDVEASRLDLLDAGQTLLQRHPDIGAMVLECTNMVPYAADLRRTFGLPVYSIYTLLTWFQAGLLPRRFLPQLDDTRP